MKKITFIILILLSSFSIAQQKEKTEYPQDVDKKTEIKINVLTLVAGPWLDVSYERLIDEESSYGLAATYNTDTNESGLSYAITPFYRRYFSGKFARGFFVEGFGVLFSAREYNYSNFFNYQTNGFETGFALGVSVGGKFVSKKGFSTELLLGVGRNLDRDSDYGAYPRIAIAVGYRF
ncbi:DUF3575 domain-containing protein [Polaribacter sp. R77954]|uniref:DUF3575 domain-containing protein n=1 Tax=Polaribacter sp. R77954 TaxID=3093870 RepID=UPI0037C9330A